MLTERLIAKAQPGDVLKDVIVPGLQVRCFPNSKAFYLYYRAPNGDQRKPKLGDTRILTLAEARQQGRDTLQLVAAGKDPAQVLNRMQRPTLRDLHARYMAEHARTKKKKTSAEGDDRIWRKHVLPRLGDRTVESIGRADMAALHHDLAHIPVQANRCMSMLSKAFNLAESWEWRAEHSNPVKVERYREKKRKRKPEPDEALRLFKAMDEMRAEQPYFIGLIELLALTGCRRNEIQTALREWVKADGIHLPDTKTEEDRVIPLNEHARAVVDALPPVPGNPYLIPGRRRGKHLVGANPLWQELCKRAGIPAGRREGIVMHDVRRFFASAALSEGLALEAVGQLLGHRSTQTTKRYAYLMTAAAQSSSEAAGRAVQRLRGK